LTVGNGTDPTKLQFYSAAGGSEQSALTIEPNSTLDLNNNHLFINYGTNPDPIATIRGYLAGGYNAAAWNGAGIDSSAAAANSHYGLGYADSADTGNPAALGSDQIEIKYTLNGDANLDGVVSGVDFTILVGNLNKAASAWDKGDFNYDGAVSGVDFTLLVGNLGKSVVGAAITLPAADSLAIDAYAAANGLTIPSVPEPACGTILMMTMVGAVAKRRRSIRTIQMDRKIGCI
jgi:hypothetical protein